MCHYHVLSGQEGGYLPNNNQITATRKEAEELAKDLADEARDDGLIVEGNARDGLYVISDPDGDERSLDDYVEIVSCDSEDCDDDLDADYESEFSEDDFEEEDDE